MVYRRSIEMAGSIYCRSRIGVYMRNNIAKRAVKIGIILLMLGIGAVIGMWNNNEAASIAENKQYGIVNTTNNWWAVVPMLLINLAFIPAGWLIGRKIDEDN